jgi:hypothetical protein
MSKITRKFQRIFTGDVPANNTIAQFGSLKAGTPTYSDDPAVIQNLAAWGAGWSGATVTNSAPALQDMNALFYVLSRQLAYLMQEGVAEWDATTIYFTGSLAYDGAHNIYQCLDDNVVGTALSDTTKWMVFYGNKRTEASTNYTVVYSDVNVVATGSSAITITLPQASSSNVGRTINVKSNLTGGSVVSIVCTGGSLMDTMSTVNLPSYSSLTFRSNGTKYEIV